MIWNVGACGEYTEYKGYIIIKQEHPILLKYEICYSKDEYSELEHIATANTLNECRRIIKRRMV